MGELTSAKRRVRHFLGDEVQFREKPLCKRAPNTGSKFDPVFIRFGEKEKTSLHHAAYQGREDVDMRLDIRLPRQM